MAKVSIFDFTGMTARQPEWYAARVLVATKDTRLSAESSRQRAFSLSDEELLRELEYMRKTIRSSWEFIDLTFQIDGVTRACAQQITRSRMASYAMQSLRVVNAASIAVENPYPLGSDKHTVFEDNSDHCKRAYDVLIAMGSAKEDARGALPLNTHSSVVCKYNFRAFVDLVGARSSLRVQGEYADIIHQMREQCIRIWPWSEKFFEHENATVIFELERIAKQMGITPGEGYGWELAKLADLLRK